MPVAIYTRVSTTSQVGGRFDSCESQAEVCREYLARHASEGWHEIACFTDAAYSGSNLNRPGIIALKRQIEAGFVKVVLIYKLERVLRSTDEWGPFRSFLQQHQCKLVSTSEDLTEDTPSGRLKNNIIMSVAEYERLNTAEKVRTKMLEQAKRGYWNYGLVPFGYGYDAKRQLLEPHPDEAPLVRRIFEEAARLVPLNDLAQRLTAEGHRTRKREWHSRDGNPRIVGGGVFRSDVLRAMLRNPLYAGRVRFQGKEYPAKHTPLVAPELWDRANAALSQAKPLQRHLRETDKHGNLLKNVVFCAHCERALVPYATALRDSGRRYRYYACGDAHQHGRESLCPIRQLPAEPLETAVVAFVSRIANHPDVLQATIEGSRRSRHRDREPFKAKLALLDQELAAVNRKIQNCVSAIAQGGAAALTEELRDQATALKATKDRLLVDHERARQELERCNDETLADDRIRRALGRFGDVFPQLEIGERKELLRLCIDRIDITAKARTTTGARQLQLRLKIPIPRLVEGMEDHLVVQRSASRALDRRTLSLDLTVVMDQQGRGLSILQPFTQELVPFTSPKPPPDPLPHRHAIHRALEWQRLRAQQPHLKGPEFARQVQFSVASVDFHLGLLRLNREIQAFLLKLRDRRAIRYFGMMRMLDIAKCAPAEQTAQFAALRAAFEVETKTASFMPSQERPVPRVRNIPPDSPSAAQRARY